MTLDVRGSGPVTDLRAIDAGQRCPSPFGRPTGALMCKLLAAESPRTGGASGCSRPRDRVYIQTMEASGTRTDDAAITGLVPTPDRPPDRRAERAHACVRGVGP